MGKNLSSVYVYRYDCLVCTKKRKHELFVVRATNLEALCTGPPAPCASNPWKTHGSYPRAQKLLARNN